jgi:hypothetical protein
MLAYLVVRETILWRRGQADDQDLTIVQDALVFAGSVIILLAAVHPPVLKAMNDLRQYLLIVGFAGLRYCWRTAQCVPITSGTPRHSHAGPGR